MKKSFLFKLVITFALLVSLFFPLTTTNASTIHSGIVTVKSTSIKATASSKSKTVGSLKKGSIVNVYSKTKSGWSQIYYKNKKAYVYTKHLKATKKISFLMDKTKIYTYEDYKGATVSLKYSQKKDGWNVWKTRDGKKVVLSERETKNALEEKEGSRVLEQLSYPLYVGKKVTYSNETTKITSLTKTVKTPAGTFKNCIEMQQLRSGRTSYFAPGVGLVQMKKGKTIELQLAQKKTEKAIKADEAKIKELIRRNTINTETENMEEYMKDVSKERRNDTQMIAMLEELFKNFDLKYELQDIKFLSMTEKEVIVEVKHKITATYIADGYQYRDNVTTSIHSIIKEDGKFVFNLSGIQDIEY
ncbi:SH3 domain-containing protein [Bacillus sp. 31A1R]|uniref:SH3 domain-containing protein n=1 Tax=Robertmurraya mangrovi TaxID=3098077 RepID=A0ABU5IXM9_9BACI|nr:SH3 domain-containing protein [Bacillus sp. 31A1R]MDZ5471896.1 SH3 domain-containing protein [Bacillus sp. 31A1R]